MSTAVFDDFSHVVRRITFRALGMSVSQVEAETISVQSATIDTTAANSVLVRDYKIVENHPLIPVHGKYRNDPTWGSFMDGIKEYRRQINEPES